ncbi:hypothetical protein D3C80_1893020 [compost metagenome]
MPRDSGSANTAGKLYITLFRTLFGSVGNLFGPEFTQALFLASLIYTANSFAFNTSKVFSTCCKPVLKLKSILDAPDLPDLVVIITTPLEPLEP